MSDQALPDPSPKVDPLRAVALFADLDDGAMERLRGDASVLELSAGELLFSEGDRRPS